MRSRIVLCTGLLLCAGCTHIALERRTVKQASTLTDLQHQQVLDNLAMFACNPEALAWHVKLTGGLVQIADQGSVAFAADLAAGVNENVRHIFSPSAGAQRGIVGQWDVDPTTEAEELKWLRLAYLKAFQSMDCASPELAEVDEKIFEALAELSVRFDIVPGEDVLQLMLRPKLEQLPVMLQKDLVQLVKIARDCGCFYVEHKVDEVLKTLACEEAKWRAQSDRADMPGWCKVKASAPLDMIHEAEHHLLDIPLLPSHVSAAQSIGEAHDLVREALVRKGKEQFERLDDIHYILDSLLDGALSKAQNRLNEVKTAEPKSGDNDNLLDAYGNLYRANAYLRADEDKALEDARKSIKGKKIVEAKCQLECIKTRLEELVKNSDQVTTLLSKTRKKLNEFDDSEELQKDELETILAGLTRGAGLLNTTAAEADLKSAKESLDKNDPDSLKEARNKLASAQEKLDAFIELTHQGRVKRKLAEAEQNLKENAPQKELRQAAEALLTALSFFEDGKEGEPKVLKSVVLPIMCGAEGCDGQYRVIDEFARVQTNLITLHGRADAIHRVVSPLATAVGAPRAGAVAQRAGAAIGMRNVFAYGPSRDVSLTLDVRPAGGVGELTERILTVLQNEYGLGYIIRGKNKDNTKRNPGLIDQAEDKVKVLQELVTKPQFSAPWFYVGCKKDVPKCACYVGRYCHCGQECYVWVMPENYQQLREFTLAVLTLAPIEKQDIVLPVSGQGAAFSPGSR